MHCQLVGSSLKLKESLRLITGSGKFIDDIKLPGMAHCRFVRSSYAHAKIKKIDASKAIRRSGVFCVVTADDIKPYTRPLLMAVPGKDPKPLYYRYLASGKTLYFGEPIAAVVAEDRYLAEDVAETIELDCEELPAVLDAEQAMKSSPYLFEEWGTNVFVTESFRAGNFDAAKKSSELYLKERFRSHRHTGTPMETRGCLADYNPYSNELTFWYSTQTPHVQKSILSHILSIPQNKLTIIAPEIGGGFGLKLNLYPEAIVVPVLSRLAKRPVKWIEDRTESFQAGIHSREQVHNVEMAATRDGVLTGLKDTIVADLGAATSYPHSGIYIALVAAGILPGQYKIPVYEYDIQCVVTNKSPTGAYRGFGQPEATFVMERLMDLLARETSSDPAEIRLRNMVKPNEFPYTTVTGQMCDSGSYSESLQKGLELLEYFRYRKKQADSKDLEKCIGIGISCNIEVTVGMLEGPFVGVGTMDSVRIKVELDGKISLTAGIASIGTGSETSLAQIVADALDVKFDDIDVSFGNTRTSPYSTGNWGSRVAGACGSCVIAGCEKLRQKILKIAGFALEASQDDLVLGEGSVYVKGSDLNLSLAEIAQIAYNEVFRLPKDMQPGLEVTEYFIPPNVSPYPDELGRLNVTGACSNSIQLAVVEVDTATFESKILRYVVVHDCGRKINPAIVEGQIIGGVVQGIGGAMMEELVYDDRGQLLTSTFMDYPIPSAAGSPDIISASVESPARYILGGFKGVGESGVIGPAACLGNAIDDALHSKGIRIVETPLSSEILWKSLHKAKNPFNC